MSVKTSAILWRIGNEPYNKQSDIITEFTSVDNFDKEYIRTVIENKIGFKLYDNNDEKQKQFEDLSNSFVDKNGIVEIRYFEDSV